MLIPKRRIAINRSKQKSLQVAKMVFPKHHVGIDLSEEKLLKLRQDFMRHNFQNRKQCSCAMCCNPRHSPFYKGLGRLTVQERKAWLRFKDQVREVS